VRWHGWAQRLSAEIQQKRGYLRIPAQSQIFKDDKLTIGVDLGDRFSHYCILNGAGEVIWEDRLPTTPKGIDEVFRKIPPSRVALENRNAFNLGKPAVGNPLSVK